MMRRIVCAANKGYFKTSHGKSETLLILGARHFDTLMHDQIKKLSTTCEATPKYSGWMQGFIDQHGVFLTRQEAWIVAVNANQIIKRVGGDEGCLYSENLY